MDIGVTISKVRKEYREYLRETHPDWADTTISTHVSDAFYLYQNTIVNNPKFDRLIATVEQLNDVIANDDSLGEGFCIGHSYFCTNATINDEWMRSVVEYELIPLLKEYWFDEAVKVKDWSRTLREVVK